MISLNDRKDYFKFAQKHYNTIYHELPNIVLDFVELQNKKEAIAIVAKGQSVRENFIYEANLLIKFLTDKGLIEGKYAIINYGKSVVNFSTIHEIKSFPSSHKTFFKLRNMDDKGLLKKVLFLGNGDKEFDMLLDYSRTSLSAEVEYSNR